MIRAVIDTNIIVAGVLTKSPRSSNRRVMDRFFAGDFELCLSRSTLAEIQHVLALPQMRKIHRLTDSDIKRLCRAMAVRSRVFVPTAAVSPASPGTSLTQNGYPLPWKVTRIISLHAIVGICTALEESAVQES